MSFAALLVLPNSRLRSLISLMLMDHGCKVDSATDLAEARHRLEARTYSVCLVNREHAPAAAEDFLALLAGDSPSTIRIAVGEGSAPVDLVLTAEAHARKHREQIDALLARRPMAHTKERIVPVPEVAPPPPPPPPPPEPRHLTVISAAAREMWQAVTKAASTPGDILLVGEPGCEFEVVAREIVRLSTDSDTGPIHLDHPHVQEETLRSLDSLARLSTEPLQFVLINELASLSSDSRHELLDHLLRRRAEISKPGIRTRFILAAPAEPVDAFLGGVLARDLLPLVTSTVSIPPLRERVADIPVIARDIVFKLADLNPSQRPRRLDASSLAVLESQLWRRNHEELVYVLRRATLSCTQRVIQPSHLQPHLGRNPRADNGTPVDFLMTAADHRAR